MTDSEMLKACPFCGKEPLLHRVPGMGRCWRVTCKYCDAGPHSAPSEAAAIAAWNARPMVPDRDEEYARGIADAACVAERDADWTSFATRGLDQWEDGADAGRDYRLGIRVGAVIAASIRALVDRQPDQRGEEVERG